MGLTLREKPIDNSAFLRYTVRRQEISYRRSNFLFIQGFDGSRLMNELSPVTPPSWRLLCRLEAGVTAQIRTGTLMRD